MGEVKPATYAVASDYLSVIKTEDGFGRFPTEIEALNHQIGLLEGERETYGQALAVAKRRRNRLAKAEGRQS